MQLLEYDVMAHIIGLENKLGKGSKPVAIVGKRIAQEYDILAADRNEGYEESKDVQLHCTCDL